MYRLSNQAAEDFAAIYEYTLLIFGGRQADAYTDELAGVLALLGTYPLMGQACPDIAPGIRRHDHQRHAVFYRQRESDVFIIRILHQRMDPLRQFDD